MHAHRHHYVDHESLKWLILIVLTLILVLVTTRSTAAESVDSVLLAKATSKVQAALLPRTRENADARAARLAVPKAAVDQRNPVPKRLWEIFELHTQNEFKAAIENWNRLVLPESDKPWRTIAVASAYLRIGNLDDARCVLTEGVEAGPANATTHHLRGVIYWMEARIATREGRLHLAEQERDLARKSFEKAVATATHLNLDEKLGWTETRFVSTQRFRRTETIFPELLMPPATPRVRDLLAVLELDDFVAKSHLGLAEISLRDGLLEQVEDHLDAAADANTDVADLYLVLGEAYEAEGRSMAATRAFMKAMTGKPKVGPAIKALRNLRRTNPLD